ncbi:glutathione S-transferase family protein [Roseovarius sp.]|uniref:glutathione S-transferase family protein n=1 Tax=Roseovarius sp. TaxID=1486281 RepID=UPI00356A6069
MRDLLALWEDPRVPVVLHSTVTSPFGRKVRMAADILGFADRIDRQDANTRDPEDKLRLVNPLGKMPCLTLGDTAIHDSPVILELFDILSAGKLIPAPGLARFEALTRARLADGITDAALLMIYEARFREESAAPNEIWRAHLAGKIERALASFEAAPPPVDQSIVPITLACTLGYLDWRQPMPWREQNPAIVAWLEAFTAATPAFSRTERITT